MRQRRNSCATRKAPAACVRACRQVAARMVLVSVLFLHFICARVAIAQILHLDAPPNPAWPTPSSVTVLADALVREADKLDAAAKSPSAQAAWRRMAAVILHTHGASPLSASSPAAIALIMVAIRKDMDPHLNTPAAELFAAEWNARADANADPMPDFARLLAGIAEMPAVAPQPCACEEGNELLKKILAVSTAASTAPDLMDSAAAVVNAAHQAAFALCAMNKSAFENKDARKKITDQVNDAVKGLNDPATRAESIVQCEKIGAMGQCIEALNQYRAVVGAPSAAKSDRIPEALRVLNAKKDPAEAARALKRVAQIISWMAQARQVNVDQIAPPLRNFARSLKRKATSQEQLGLARVESLTKSGFDPNDPALATIFVAQEQLVQDINTLERLSLALNSTSNNQNNQSKQTKQTKQLISVIQTLCAGLNDQSFSDLFRERIQSMDRQLELLLTAQKTPNMSAAVQAEVAMIHQRWLDAWAANSPAKALENIEDFVRWAAAKRALDALDAAPSEWPSARLDWAASRDALRLCVSDGDGALANDNLKAMKPFLAPLRNDAAASLACGLRLSQSEKISSETPAVTRDLCAMQNDKSVKVIAALLRLEQERRTLLKTNPQAAVEFLKARNEWVAELAPSLQDRLPDGLLPPATP